MLVNLEGGKFASNLKRTYIHEVLPLHMTYTASSSTRSRSNPSICYFTTYIEAALDAYAHGLIRLHGLRAVVADAKADFQSISDAAWASAEGAAAIEAELKAKQLLSAIRLHARSEKHSNAERGDGKKKISDGLTDGASYDEVMSKLPSRKKGARDPFKGAHSPGWKRELRLRELNTAIEKVNTTLATLLRASRAIKSAVPLSQANYASSAISPEHLAAIRPLMIPCRYRVGSVVMTAYGLGIVQWFRPQDGIYIVLVHWGSGQELPDFEACLNKDGPFDDGPLSRSVSRDSHSGQPTFEKADQIPALCHSRQYNTEKKVLFPCLSGSVIKIMSTAACLCPAPVGAPDYMSSEPRARTSTIWKSVTGLLGSKRELRREKPRSGRRRTLSARPELRLESRDTATSLSTMSEGTCDEDKDDITSQDLALSTSPLAPVASTDPAVVTSPARKNGGVLSLISTMWKGKVSAPIGSVEVATVKGDPGYLEEYYDCLVWTPYGTGHVVYIHPADPKSGRLGAHLDAFSEDMVVVELHWGPICSIRRRDTTIMSGVIKGVHVGIGGYPITCYKSPKPTVYIPQKGNGSNFEDEKNSSAIASFLRYSPQGNNSRPSSNRVRASTDGAIDVGDTPVPSNNFESSPLVGRSLRSMSAEQSPEPSEPLTVVTPAVCVPLPLRSRANTIDSPMSVSNMSQSNRNPSQPVDCIAVSIDATPSGYRALLAEWLYSTKNKLNDSVYNDECFFSKSVITEEEEEAKVQQALLDRSGLGIITNNHVESTPVLLLGSLDDSDDSDNDNRAKILGRKASFNEGYDPLSF